MTTVPKVLFLSHEASLSGAPMMLLHLVRWLAREGLVRPVVGLRRGGQLTAEFQKVCPVLRMWRDDKPSDLLDGIQLVYANTACHGSMAAEFQAIGIPVISHIHEMAHEMGLRNPVELGRQLSASQHFIACSRAVEDCLKCDFQVPPDAISLIHEPVDVQAIERQVAQVEPEVARQSLGIPPDSPVFCGVGTACWRKGTDIFLAVAASVCRRLPEARGVWVGRVPAQERNCLSHDLRLMGLEGKVIFTGEQANPFPYVAMADTFCLTSREDPYPLVMMEASLLGKPMIGFEHSGGVTEFAPHVGGHIVPYLDASAMADAVLDSFTRRPGGHSKEAASRWIRENLDISTIGPAIYRVICANMLLTSNGVASQALQRLAKRLPTLCSDPFAATIEAAWDGAYAPVPLWQGALRVNQTDAIQFHLPPVVQGASRLRLRLTFNHAPLTVAITDIHVEGTIRSKRPPAFRPGPGGIELSPTTFALLESPARLYLDLPVASLPANAPETCFGLKLDFTNGIQTAIEGLQAKEKEHHWLALPHWLKGRKAKAPVES